MTETRALQQNPDGSWSPAIPLGWQGPENQVDFEVMRGVGHWIGDGWCRDRKVTQTLVARTRVGFIFTARRHVGWRTPRDVPVGPEVRTPQEAWDAAREGSPFSNGTEGYAWQGEWCGTCKHDAYFQRTGNGSGCPLLGVAIMGRTPSEWFEQPWQQIAGRPEGETAPVLGDTYHCVEWRDKDERGGGESRPKPEPRGMDGLFDRPERGVRMLSQPRNVEVRA